MKYIYVDEAGTSAKEPVVIVAGLIIDADRHWLAIASHIKALVERWVPERLQDGFVCHATDIINGYRDAPDWSVLARVRLVKELVKIPKRFKASLALGLVRDRKSEAPKEKTKFSEKDLDHALAFALCLTAAETYMRDFANPSEVATIVAEENPRMATALKRAGDMLKDQGLGISLSYDRSFWLHKTNLLAPAIDASTKITRIVDSINFDSKKRAPILQVADACAFSVRRYLAGGRWGDEFVRAMSGPEAFNQQKWDGPARTILMSFFQIVVQQNAENQ